MFWSRDRRGASGISTRKPSTCAPAFEATSIVLEKRPRRPRMSTVARNEPVPPGARIQGDLGKSATVQPHDGRTSMICTGSAPVFVTEN